MKDWKTIFFYLMIVIIVILSVYILVFTRTEGYKCMSNSGVYFINQTNKAGNGETFCNCFVIGDGSSTRFTLDRGGFKFNFNTEQPK